MNSMCPRERESTEPPDVLLTVLTTDDLVRECLASARNLGFTQSYSDGTTAIEMVVKNMNELSTSTRLSTTQRSVLATAVLFYLWNSIRTHHQYEPLYYGPQIIHINDNQQLSDVMSTCFVWMTTPDFAANSSHYFNLTRSNAVNWSQEITKDFNGMRRVVQIGELNSQKSSLKWRDDAETDLMIKSLLSQLSRGQLSAQCTEPMQNLSSRLSQIWLAALAIPVLSILCECERESKNCDHLRGICHAALAWIQPIDQDLIAIEEFTSKVSESQSGFPGSIIVWREPTFGAFSKIWHRVHTYEGMKDPWELEIELTENTVVCHSTTLGTLVEMLQNGDGSSIKIKGRHTDVNYTGANLVWTGVQLTDPEIGAIPDTYGGQQRLIASPGRYGSVSLQFPLKSVGDRARYFAHIFSTRLYKYQYSQTILVAPFESLFLRQHDKCETGNPKVSVKLTTMDSPILLLGYKWKLGFSNQSQEQSHRQSDDGNPTGKFWTHPELVFYGDLQIPLDSCRISFIDHTCGLAGKKCDDCGVSATESRTKFDELLRETGLERRYEIQTLGDKLNLKIVPATATATTDAHG